MNVVIAYFSGTGNTKAVALAYQTALQRHNHRVHLMSIEEGPTLPDHDLLIVGGPIYAGNMPDELIIWLRKNVGTTTNKRAIVFSTSAGLKNAHGVFSVGKKLIKKGYSLANMSTFEMPRNFYIDKYDPTPEAVQDQQFKDAAEKVLSSISYLDQAEEIKVNQSVLMIDLMADLFRIMAKSLGKSYKIDESCIGCGICQKQCPKHNIDYKTKTYSNQCMMCTRCIHGCPVNAISYKGKKIAQYRSKQIIL